MFLVSKGIVSPKLAWHPSKLLQELVAVATILLSAPLILKFVKGSAFSFSYSARKAEKAVLIVLFGARCRMLLLVSLGPWSQGPMLAQALAWTECASQWGFMRARYRVALRDIEEEVPLLERALNQQVAELHRVHNLGMQESVGTVAIRVEPWRRFSSAVLRAHRHGNLGIRICGSRKDQPYQHANGSPRRRGTGLLKDAEPLGDGWWLMSPRAAGKFQQCGLHRVIESNGAHRYLCAWEPRALDVAHVLRSPCPAYNLEVSDLSGLDYSAIEVHAIARLCMCACIFLKNFCALQSF